MLSQSASVEIEKTIALYPEPGSALLPVLRIIQREYGWLSPEALRKASSLLGVPEATVRGVSTFHVMLRNKPAGRNVIQLCTNVSCMLMGAESVLDQISSRYAVEPGGTSSDGRFTLVVMECIGLCDRAPAMFVNSDVHTLVGVENVADILERYL